MPRDRVVVSHQHLPEEWGGTQELVALHAKIYGLRLETVSRGEPLLDYVRRRGRWPDAKNRFCTSEFKRGPGRKVVTKLFREDPGDVLYVFGFRAEESRARAKRPALSYNKRASCESRAVYDWLPIHKMGAAEVWEDIRGSGVPYHPAYDLGMPRLSCCFCIFAPRAALMVAGKANPDLLDEYCRVEGEIGHSFQYGKPISGIRDALRAGEAPDISSDDGNWNM